MSKNYTNKKPTILELKTSSKKIIDFYSKYPNIDFDTVNHLIIDLFEEMFKNISGDMTKNATKDIFNSIKEINNLLLHNKSDIQSIKENILNNNKDIIIKLFDIKKEYIDELKLLIDKHQSDNILKIIDRIEKENFKLINDIIPKTNTIYYNQYDNLIKSFKEDIKNINHSDIFEKKYNELIRNIETSIINYMSNSEQRLQNNITELKDNYKNQQKVNEEFFNFLEKHKNSSFKGQLAENHIESILNTIYNSAEIKRTSIEAKSGDFIMFRENHIPILFEIKNYNRNVPSEEVLKFLRDASEKNICAIMISISTGICNKNNFQIDITDNNNICLYIHNMNYDPDKIKLAVDIIDNLYSKLKLDKNNNVHITSELLNLINKEYHTFLLKRDSTLTHIKESTKKTIQFIEELELMNLNNLLSSKFTFNNNHLKCKFCNTFIGTNAKSLAVHSRKCKNNINSVKNTSDKSEDHS